MGQGEGERLPRHTWTSHENVQVASWRGGAVALAGLVAERQGPEPHCAHTPDPEFAQRAPETSPRVMGTRPH